MRIWVSPLSRVHDVAAQVRPQRVISLLSPGDVFPQIDGVAADGFHRVAVHDVSEATPGMTVPDADHVRDLIRFLDAWSVGSPLVVHCWAGVSRSTATAFIAACRHNPDTDESVIARAIRDASPTAAPNTRLVAFADQMLGRDGRMIAAIAGLGAPSLTIEAEPFSIASRFAG